MLRAYLVLVAVLAPVLIGATWIVTTPRFTEPEHAVAAGLLFVMALYAEHRPMSLDIQLLSSPDKRVTGTVTLTATFALAVGVLTDPPSGAICMYVASLVAELSRNRNGTALGTPWLRHLANPAQEAIAVYAGVVVATLVIEPGLLRLLGYVAAAGVIAGVNALLVATAHRLAGNGTYPQLLRSMGITVASLIAITVVFAPIYVELADQPWLLVLAAVQLAPLQGLAQRSWDNSSLRLNARLVRQAIARGEIRMHYQPKIDLISGLMIGTEALVRWYHPNGTMVSPAVLLGLVGRAGLDVEFTLHVIERVEADRHAHDFVDLEVSINVAASALADRRVRERLGALTPPVGVEITEYEVLEDVDLVAGHIDELHGRRVHVAIDDFGSGATSMAWLDRLRAQYIKLDRSFVGNERGISAVVDVSQRYGCLTVLEGIETPEQCQQGRAASIDAGQGYLFARPMPAHELSAFIEQYDPGRWAA